MKRNSQIIVLAVVISISIALNLLTFIVAYPEIFKIDPGCCAIRPLAKDFSAFYTGAWRLFHDPSNLYTKGALNDGEYFIVPQPEQFKYLPSFLIFISPFLLLSYQNALVLFDIIQFVLLIPIAFLIYKLLERKGVAAVAIVSVIALLLPFPLSGWGASASYYWQWAEGQSKVLNLFLILIAFYLGKKNRPYLSGIIFGISFFDPRFALLSIPLFVMYNQANLRKSVVATIAAFGVSNLPLLYPGTGSSFIQTVLNSGLETPVFPYAYIPLLTIIALSILNWKEIGLSLSRLSFHPIR
jgi:hypothetical protein